MKCKWQSDDFDEICVNADCPYCADFCPVTEYCEICKYMEYSKNFAKSKSIIKSREEKHGLGASEMTKIEDIIYIRTPLKNKTMLHDKNGINVIGTRQDYHYSKILPSGELMTIIPIFKVDLSKAEWERL